MPHDQSGWPCPYIIYIKNRPLQNQKAGDLGIWRERNGSVVECLTRDRRVAGSSLTDVTVLWSLSKTHLS